MLSRRVRIIVADDQPDMLRMLVLLLSKDFDIVGAVNNGRDLVREVVSLRPDVVVSDIRMPEITGPEAMHQLAGLGHDIPFVFVSSEPELIAQCRCSSVDKMDAGSELVAAVHMTASGERFRSRRCR